MRYNDIALEKRVKTHQDKYGVSFALQHPKFKDKVTKTSYLKYKRKHHKQRHISEELLILLDNFDYEDTRKAVKLIGDKCLTESSGNINENTLRAYAECGVNYISSGALTHSVYNMDLSLKAL